MAKDKLDRWKSLISEWEKSGQVRKEFCRDKGVTVATFSYWRTKINKMAPRTAVSQDDGLVRITMPNVDLSQGLVLEWPDGLRLRIPGNIQPQLLLTVLRTIKASNK